MSGGTVGVERSDQRGDGAAARRLAFARFTGGQHRKTRQAIAKQILRGGRHLHAPAEPTLGQLVFGELEHGFRGKTTREGSLVEQNSLGKRQSRQSRCRIRLDLVNWRSCGGSRGSLCADSLRVDNLNGGGNLRVDKLSAQGRNWGRRLDHVHRPRYGNFTARHVVKRAEQPLIFGGGRGEAIGHLLRGGGIERIEGPENDAGIFRRGGALAVATGDNKWRKIGGRHAKLQLRGGSGRNHFLAGREHQKSRRNRNFKSLLGGTHIRLSKYADGRLPMGEGCEVGDVKACRRSSNGRPTAGIRLKIVIKNNRVRVARFPGIFEGDAFRCTRVTSDGLDLLPIDAKNQVSDPDGISRGQGDIEIGQRAIADVYELIANTHVDICS